jgi:hypothetical protein
MSLTAQDILSVSVDDLGRLFQTQDIDGVKARYRELAREWHPDVCHDPLADRVMSHLGSLFTEASRLASNGVLAKPGFVAFRCADNKRRELRRLDDRPFELGRRVVGERVVCWLISQHRVPLADSAIAMIRGIGYSDPAYRDEFERYMPTIIDSFDTVDGERGVVLSKTPDVLPLDRLLAWSGGRVDPKHAAWMISSLLNSVCFLHSRGTVHGALGVETLFVSAQHHSILPLGGWWYAMPAGSRVRFLPTWSAGVMTRAIREAKVADPGHDLSLVRRVGRQLLGDETGMSMTAPQPMIDFFRSAPLADAVSDYLAWGEVLTKSFWPRRFVDLLVSPSDVYGKV